MEVSSTYSPIMIIHEAERGYHNKCLTRNNGLAEVIFNSMERKTPEAYYALICGMVKHGKADGAWEYYNQMLGKH